MLPIRRLLAISIFLTLFLVVQNARAAIMTVLTPNVRLGEVVVLKFDEAPKQILFESGVITAFPYQKNWRALIPLPLTGKTGTYRLHVEFANGTTIDRAITVSRKPAPIVILPVPPKLGLTDKEVTQKLADANTSLKTTVAEVSGETRFSLPFGLALTDNRRISSVFGEIRKTGNESVTHLGTDFGAAKGRAVAAINAGVIKSAYLDPIYGNSIIIDHGRGIYSMYLHLNTMKVKTGDAVPRGKVIGTVGDTGLASAPHLHLSIKINGISVDPIQFVSAFK